jgi:acyl-coenzyme A thioesterase PaaI-like protein
VSEHDLLAATACTPDPSVEQRWHARLDASWDTPMGVHGGVLATVGAQALRAAADDPSLILRTLRVLFLEPPPRDAVLDATVLRRGGSSAFVRAVLHGGDPASPAAEISGVLTRDRDGIEWLDAGPPEVDPPEMRRSLAERIAQAVPSGPSGVLPPLFTHLDERGVLGHLPWDDGWVPDQPARYARWYRWSEAPRRADGTLDPIGLLPLADLPGPAIWVRSAPDGPVVGGISLDMGVHLLDDPGEEWILADTRARYVGRGNVVAETDLWSGDRLVAVSTQTMLLRVIPVPPRG